jgi:hypothetical protein
MRIGRLEVGLVKHLVPESKFIWFEYARPSCLCRILTICDVYVIFYDKECKCLACNNFTCTCEVEDVSSD